MKLNLKHSLVFFTEILIISTLNNNIIAAQTDSELNLFGKESETNKNLWGVNLGYFPNINNESYVSSGLSASFTSETLHDSKLNFGWYLLFRKTFEDEFDNLKSEGLSLVGTLSYLWNYKSDRIFLRTGIGIATLIYPTIINLIAVEYQYHLNKNMFLSFALVQEMARIKYPLPPIISVGIIF